MPTSIVCDREENNMIEKSSQQDFRRVIGSIRGPGKDHHEMNQPRTGFLESQAKSTSIRSGWHNLWPSKSPGSVMRRSPHTVGSIYIKSTCRFLFFIFFFLSFLLERCNERFFMDNSNWSMHCCWLNSRSNPHVNIMYFI